MCHNPERLAWTVLLISFCLCVALAVSVPLAVRSFLSDSADPAARILQVQQGTALLKRPVSPDFVGVTDVTTDVPDGSVIKADQFTQAVLTVRDRGSETNLAIIQLYANTELTVQTAGSPRFDASPNPHRIDLGVNSGRIRVNVPAAATRPVAASVESPQGKVIFTPGTYAVEVTNEELQVTAREGTATVSARGAEVVIESLQRAVVKLGQPPQGGLSGERTLITNGSFTAPINPHWAVEHGPQDENEPTGTLIATTVAGRRAALFARTGEQLNHAETRLVRELHRDVTDAASLTLHFAVLVEFHDVPICGSLGSECPLMVRIDYRDRSGTDREWVQGFYSAAVTDPQNVNPRFCQTCSTRTAHRAVVPSTWFAYDSGNLIDELTVGDLTPAQITRIVFYASGHAYRSAITDVELLVQD